MYLRTYIVRVHCLLATATGLVNCLGYSKWLWLQVMLYVYQIECCICGYHVYHRIWHPIIGEVLGTTRDRCAVAVLEEETCCVVGHLPRLISRECFLRTGGTITAEVTGRRRDYDLSDGGLDIPIAVVRTRRCYDFMTRLNCAS